MVKKRNSTVVKVMSSILLGSYRLFFPTPPTLTARYTTCPSSGYGNTIPVLGRVDRAPVKWIYCPCAMDMKTVCVTTYAQITTSLQCVSLFTVFRLPYSIPAIPSLFQNSKSKILYGL